MKTYIQKLGILGAFLFALMPALPASAQTVTKQPQFVASQAWLDYGNGPTEVYPVEGNGILYSSLGTGVGSTSGSSTTLTLTGTPAVPPCVGCIISGTGITSGTTVSVFNGTTTITLSAAMTVAASTALSWGAACPTSGQPTAASLSPPINMRASTGERPAFPMYTQARICVYGGSQGGVTTENFAIGGW
jgi:hypothetical protein